MQLTMLKCKLHRACVTHADLEYEGSCAIDKTLMELGNIREYEQVHIYNVTNGERFTTYAIVAEAGSGIISINGAAAHKARPGDIIIICTYAIVDQVEVNIFHPIMVYLDEHNQASRIAHSIAIQNDVNNELT